jgi:hypothetical protein
MALAVLFIVVGFWLLKKISSAKFAIFAVRDVQNKCKCTAKNAQEGENHRYLSVISPLTIFYFRKISIFA